MNSFELIPRLRVNYSFFDLFQALFVSEKKKVYRDKCESVLRNFYDNEEACFTPSARDAIYEVLIRLPQEIVVVPAYTCIAVVESVILAGKKIVYSENDAVGFNSSYLECIVPNSIVLATHQYGLPCNIEVIAAKCKEVGAVLIEDCATSMGTTVNGKKTGTFGDYAVVSFNASKLMNVPPYGGVLISKNKQMIETIRNTAEWQDGGIIFKINGIVRGLAFVVTKNKIAYRCFHYLTMQSKGKHQRSEHETPSVAKTDLYKYKFSEWQASILLRQLLKLGEIFEKRQALYSYYDTHINNDILKKPEINSDAVCCRYAVLVNERDRFYDECIKAGVDLDFSHCYLGCPNSFTKEHQMADQILNLPFDINLSRKELNQVVAVVNSIK